MASPNQNILLVLGAGPNVGRSIAQHFSKVGSYKTILVSRNPSTSIKESCDLVISADFEDAKCINGIFEEVKEKIGVPNVVVYNAYSSPFNADPLAVPFSDFTAGLNVNLISPYAAAQAAILGFRTLPKEVLKTFIYTGNCLTHSVYPVLICLGIGKAGAGHLVESAAKGYEEEGFRFYYGDERTPTGSPIFTAISGEAHAELYYELASSKEVKTWEQTFVKGKGYVNFNGKVGELPVIGDEDLGPSDKPS